MMRSIFVVVLFLSLPISTFAQASFQSIEAFLKSTVGASDQLSAEARGDLNNDKLEDWVGVIRNAPEDDTPTYQLYLLLRLPEGGYRLAEKTPKAEIPGMGCCWLEDLTIRRGSIFIQNNAKTAATMEAATHQFKLHKGEWRLVGLRVYLTDHTPQAPMTNDSDMNVLTGLVIEKVQKGDGRPVSRRRTKQFPVAYLRDFDFSNGFGSE